MLAIRWTGKALLCLAAMILLFRCWFQNNFQITRGRSYSRKLHEKRKFFTLISSNHRLKIVYMDNEHIEDTSVQNTFQNDNSNDSGLHNVGHYVVNDSDIVQIMPNIEWDETIDYNNVENYETIENKRKTCSKEDPKKIIVLVKCRYYNNEPFTNIMYRYGDLNQLTVALAKRSTFESYWPLRFHPSFIDTSLLYTNRVHMLINSPYRYSTMNRYMPKDAIFIGVIYDPIKVHLSTLVKRFALQRYKSIERLKMIQKLYKKNRTLEDQYNNTIAADLGYPLKQFNHHLAPNEFINELEKQFDVILIGDYVEESLVVLKNTLCWSFSDIAFISTKEQDFYPDIPHQLKSQIETQNKIDQIIYEHFNQTFWEKVEAYGPTFTSDLKELKRLKEQVEQDCSGSSRTLGLREDKRNIEPLCKRIQWTEQEYISYLKRRRPLITDEITNGLKHLNDSLYTFYNTTSKEILRLESL